MQISLSIPDHASFIPAKGSTIKIGDPLFSITNAQLYSVHIATELEIKTEEIFQYVTKSVGDTVQQGELVAQKKKFIGSKNIQSPISGTIANIDHISGDVVISSTISNALQQDSNQITSFFTGKLISIDQAKSMFTIEIEHAEPISAKAFTHDFGGELYFFTDESLFYTATEKDIAGKVIVIADLKNHIAAKFETLGAAGFLYIHGQDPTDVPDVALSKTEFERLVNSKKKYILFSGFEKKAFIYENR